MTQKRVESKQVVFPARCYVSPTMNIDANTALFFDRFSANRVFDFAETLSFLLEF